MTETGGIVAMMLFALATSATPGPVNVISAMAGARYGIVRSLPYVIGATTSFVAILLVVGLGVGVIQPWIAQLSSTVMIAGSCYLVYLALRIALADGRLEIGSATARCPGFGSGLLTQALNPKAWIVSLSAISIYVLPKADMIRELILFAVLFFAICAFSLTGWVYAGQKVARLTGDVTIFNKIMAMLLVLSVAAMVFDAFG